MRVFNRNDNDVMEPATLIKMLERASFEEKERIRVLLDAVAVFEGSGTVPSGREKVLIVGKK